MSLPTTSALAALSVGAVVGAHNGAGEFPAASICLWLVVALTALAALCMAPSPSSEDTAGYTEDQPEHWLRQFFEHAPEAYHLHAPDGTILDGNGAAERLTGYRRDQVLGKPLLELGILPPKQLPQAARMLAEGARGQTAGPEQFCVIRPDGTHSLVETRTYPVTIGERALVLSISRDITTHKQGEQQLHRQHDLAMDIIQNSPTFFVTVDTDGKVMMMNGTMLQMLGYSLEQVVGAEYVSTFVVGQDQPMARQIAAQLGEGRRPDAHEVRMLTRDGRELLVQWHHSPVLGEDGRLDYHFGVGIDVTVMRKLERQMHELQKMEAVRVLAGGVAHDFNNVLATIMGRTSLMLTSGDFDAATRKQLQQMIDDCERGASLVQRLLTFSRRVEPRRQMVDLCRMVQESCKLLTDTLSKLVELRTSLADDLWPVHADPYQIEQVLLNLAINAAEAMPRGGILTIRADNFTADQRQSATLPDLIPGKRYVSLSVADTGPGIAPDARGRIFEPFFTSKSRAGHSGLGLAVVHGIVQAHGGVIEVAEEPRGAVFRIYLPAAEADSDAAGVVSNPTCASGHRVLVLVVDDEPAVARLTADILHQEGHRTLIAHNGAEAIRVFGARHTDIGLVILDLIMPVMDGETCLVQIHRICSDVPVLLLSGHLPEPQMLSRLQRMSVGFLRKPFAVEQMSEMVSAILEGRQRPESDG